MNAKKAPQPSSTKTMASNANNKRYLSLYFFILPILITAAPPYTGRAMNEIDRCWRTSPDYSANRAKLATCSIGFAGKMLENQGPGLKTYVVTDASDAPARPKAGTLRYGATMIPGKVWITFERDMKITLKRPLLVSSGTAIDGRGAHVVISQGDGFLLHKVKNVIIHGLTFRNIRPTKEGPIMTPEGHVEEHGESDGDAIGVMLSSKIWIDHNTLSEATDGLIDVTHMSTDVTISNNWFHDHDKVMLLGHADGYFKDKKMRVTITFNRFGPNCDQRMPRVRYGYAHVVNNHYLGWKEYAIGGSSHPSITSQSNVFEAPNDNKEVTRMMSDDDKWAHLKSMNDEFLNGAKFEQEGGGANRPEYMAGQWFHVSSAAKVMDFTKDAGALRLKGYLASYEVLLFKSVCASSIVTCWEHYPTIILV